VVSLIAHWGGGHYGDGGVAAQCSIINIPPQVENRRIQMRLALSCTLLASALLCLSACNKAESPERVQEDVAKAQSNAAEENAKADAKVKQVEAEAAKDRADALAKVADKSVDAVADSAVTQAEGDTKIALAKCQALEGDAQKSCKDEANAHLDVVRARAEVAKAN
jgi:cell division protein FtsB